MYLWKNKHFDRTICFSLRITITTMCFVINIPHRYTNNKYRPLQHRNIKIQENLINICKVGTPKECNTRCLSLYGRLQLTVNVVLADYHYMGGYNSQRK